MKRQFNNSGPGDGCDHCGRPMKEHVSGDYYCPESKVRTLSAFHCDYGCKVPSHVQGCPFFRKPHNTGERQ